VLIVGRRPSAGAVIFVRSFGKMSKPNAAAAAMPFSAIDGCSDSFAGVTALGASIICNALRPPAGLALVCGAGGNARNAALPTLGGTTMTRLGLRETLLPRRILFPCFLSGLLLRRPFPHFFFLRPRLCDLPLELLLRELDLCFFLLRVFFFLFSLIDLSIVDALWIFTPRFTSYVFDTGPARRISVMRSDFSTAAEICVSGTFFLQAMRRNSFTGSCSSRFASSNDISPQSELALLHVGLARRT